jgi:hypothetical protein
MRVAAAAGAAMAAEVVAMRAVAEVVAVVVAAAVGHPCLAVIWLCHCRKLSHGWTQPFHP